MQAENALPAGLPASSVLSLDREIAYNKIYQGIASCFPSDHEQYGLVMTFAAHQDREEKPLSASISLDTCHESKECPAYDVVPAADRSYSPKAAKSRARARSHPGEVSVVSNANKCGPHGRTCLHCKTGETSKSLKNKIKCNCKQQQQNFDFERNEKIPFQAIETDTVRQYGEEGEFDAVEARGYAYDREGVRMEEMEEMVEMAPKLPYHEKCERVRNSMCYYCVQLCMNQRDPLEYNFHELYSSPITLSNLRNKGFLARNEVLLVHETHQELEPWDLNNFMEVTKVVPVPRKEEMIDKEGNETKMMENNEMNTKEGASRVRDPREQKKCLEWFAVPAPYYFDAGNKKWHLTVWAMKIVQISSLTHLRRFSNVLLEADLNTVIIKKSDDEGGNFFSVRFE